MKHFQEIGNCNGRRCKSLVRLLIGFPIVMMCVLCCPDASKAQTPDAAARIYREAALSIFVISVRDEKGQPISFGTGFLIDKNTLATNFHVVEGPFIFLEQGPVRIPVTVDKRDPVNDLAVVKVSIDISATPLRLSIKKLVPGENIFVIGNPEGLDKSISTGVVAANREFDGRKLLQITAPISHGSSGGPVLDSAGEVVGVTVAMMKNGQNLNFAVPTEKLQQLLVGKGSDTTDLAALFRTIGDLKTLQTQQQYSQDPDSDWQKTNRQIGSLFKPALDQAAQDPNLLVRVAEAARDTNPEIELAAAQRATDIKPSSESNFLLGEALRSKAWFAEQAEKDDLLQKAEKSFRAALRLAKAPSAEIYYDLADVLEDRGSTRDAELDFHRALELNKNAGNNEITVNSIRGLTRTTYALKNPREAESWFSMLVDMGAANVWDWQQEGARLHDQGKYNEAAKAYQNAATLGGGWTNRCRAAVDFWGSNDDEALSSARECINAGTGKQDSDKWLATAHNLISDILNKRGVYAEALSHAKEAVDLDSSNAWHFQDEAEALFGLRRFQEAINASNQAIRLSDGKYASMHFRLGTSYFELENWEFAKQSFEKAAQLDPTDAASAFNAALCFRRLGYTIDAANWFEEVLRRDPKYKDRAYVESQIALLKAGAR
jgi:S1-C subfamily serine protease/Flp pilus assembly protein TadD